MICSRCGAQLPEGTESCTVCGNRLDAPSQMPQYVYEKEPPAVEAAEKKSKRTYYNYGEEFSGTKYNKRKRRRRGVTLVVSLCAVAAVAAVVLFNLNTIIGFCIKTFASPDAYFAYVEKNTVGGAIAQASKSLGEYSKASVRGVTTDGRVELRLGEELRTELEASGESYDWADDIYLDTHQVINGKLSQSKTGLYIGDVMLVGIDHYVNGETNQMLTGIPGITDNYLLSTAEDVVTFSNGSTLTAAELAEILPEQKVLSEILTRYSGVILDHSTGIQKATEEFTVDGVVEKLVMLELNFGRSDMITLQQALLNELGADEQVLGIIDDIGKMLIEKKMIEADTDLRAELLNRIDSRLEFLENARADVEVEIPTLRYRDFVNGKHEIVGREITVNGDIVFYYLTVKDGGEFGTEMRIGSEVDVLGYGTDKNGEINATFEMTEDGADLMTVEVTGVSYDRSEGEMSGKIRLLPTPRLIYNLELPTDLAKMGFGLEIEYDVDTSGTDLTLNILSDTKLYFGLDISMDVGGPQEVVLPTEGVINGDTDAESWNASLDFEQLLTKAQDAGLPKIVTGYISYFRFINELSSIGNLTEQNTSYL